MLASVDTTPASELSAPGLEDNECKLLDERRCVIHINKHIHEDFAVYPDVVFSPRVPKPAHPENANARTTTCDAKSGQQRFSHLISSVLPYDSQSHALKEADRKFTNTVILSLLCVGQQVCECPWKQ
jgi:hypothetical protein